MLEALKAKHPEIKIEQPAANSEVKVEETKPATEAPKTPEEAKK